MDSPTMWVSDTHSSHIILMRGYFAKWGTTPFGDLTGVISMMVDIIAGARRPRGWFMLTDSRDSRVPRSLRDVAHPCCSDHADVARPFANVAVAPTECREWGCASSARRSVQGRVSQRVQGGGSLYQIPKWWVAVRGGRGMPTSERESRPGTSRRQFQARACNTLA